MSYHQLRKPKSPTRKDQKQTGQEEGMEQISSTQAPEADSTLEAGTAEKCFINPDMEIVEVGEEPLKLPLKPKQELVE